MAEGLEEKAKHVNWKYAVAGGVALALFYLFFIRNKKSSSTPQGYVQLSPNAEGMPVTVNPPPAPCANGQLELADGTCAGVPQPIGPPSVLPPPSTSAWRFAAIGPDQYQLMAGPAGAEQIESPILSGATWANVIQTAPNQLRNLGGLDYAQVKQVVDTAVSPAGTLAGT